MPGTNLVAPEYIFGCCTCACLDMHHVFINEGVQAFLDMYPCAGTKLRCARGHIFRCDRTCLCCTSNVMCARVHFPLRLHGAQEDQDRYLHLPSSVPPPQTRSHNPPFQNNLCTRTVSFSFSFFLAIFAVYALAVSISSTYPTLLRTLYTISRTMLRPSYAPSTPCPRVSPCYPLFSLSMPHCC